ncbi:hypothetical protein Acr_14g0005470 [Actinidia rufa]|uniref:Retrotransposon Copia-like N-terminal domain-containing protein n=1 Tax=Actinidia rufa TaxID=165716 RepID=A0A7J0FQC0_9ERIC|nr:hypothetical protein Acr_14g0005470 [Actinidia rufa]
MATESSSVSSSASSAVSSSSRNRDRRPITSIILNDQNYAIWAKAVEVYFEGESISQWLTDEPPAQTTSTYATWKSEDARVRSDLWNVMEPQISGPLMFLPTAKLVWRQAQEMFYGVNNLRRTYDLHQEFFSLSMGERTLETHYAKCCGVCEQIKIAQPISADIQVMERQRQSLFVARFLSSLPSPTYDSVRSQILGERTLPSLGEVFSHIRQATISDIGSLPASQLPFDRSALVTTVSRGGYSRGGSTSGGVGRSGSGRDSGRGGFNRGGFSRGGSSGDPGRGSRAPGGGGRGRGREPRHCSWCKVDNHTIDYCWDLHGRPSARQVTVLEDDSSQDQHNPPSPPTPPSPDRSDYMLIWEPSPPPPSPPPPLQVYDSMFVVLKMHRLRFRSPLPLPLRREIRLPLPLLRLLIWFHLQILYPLRFVKGKETSDLVDGRQFPFFEELHAIFTEREKNMQRMLLESEAGSTQAKKKVKRISGDLSSEELSYNEDEDEVESDGQRVTSSSNPRKRKDDREKVEKEKRLRIPRQPSTGNVNNSGNSIGSLQEMLQEFLQQQQRIEMMWKESIERHAYERQMLELKWRQSMEKLERERLMAEQAWREREEQRRIREESRAEKRDALLMTLFNRLINENHP